MRSSHLRLKFAREQWQVAVDDVEKQQICTQTTSAMSAAVEKIGEATVTGKVLAAVHASHGLLVGCRANIILCSWCIFALFCNTSAGCRAMSFY